MSDEAAALERLLDGVAEPGAASDGDILDAVERLVALRSDQLADVVARYAGSPSAVLVRSLAFVLAQSAQRRGESTSNVVYQLIGAAGRSDDASTLINLLTTIQRQAMFRRAWVGAAPVELVPFFLHCLMQADLVRSTALQVLSGLVHGKWLAQLPADEVGRVRDAVRAVAATPFLQPALDELADFLAG